MEFLLKGIELYFRIAVLVLAGGSLIFLLPGLIVSKINESE